MTTKEVQLRTVGVMATKFEVPISRVLYLIRKLGIQHIGRTGIIRVYDQMAEDMLRAAIERATQPQAAGSGIYK
jgi:hypothetical protein